MHLQHSSGRDRRPRLLDSEQWVPGWKSSVRLVRTIKALRALTTGLEKLQVS